jgi:hypothetical protein
VRAVTRRGSYAVQSGCTASGYFSAGCASSASCAYMRQAPAPASSASNQASTSCSSATAHHPHFVQFRQRFDAGHVTVSTNDHALSQLQVQADIADIIADIDLKRKQLFTQFELRTTSD